MLSLLLSFFTGVSLTFLFLYFGGFIGVVVVPGEVKVDRVPREIGVQAVEGEKPHQLAGSPLLQLL